MKTKRFFFFLLGTVYVGIWESFRQNTPDTQRFVKEKTVHSPHLDCLRGFWNRSGIELLPDQPCAATHSYDPSAEPRSHILLSRNARLALWQKKIIIIKNN